MFVVNKIGIVVLNKEYWVYWLSLVDRKGMKFIILVIWWGEICRYIGLLFVFIV